MAVARVVILAFATLSAVDAAATLSAVEESVALDKKNPIRKVVNMLQAMQKRVEKEGRKEEDLYEKFECYCKNGAGDLEKSVSAAESKVPMLESDIKEAEAKKKQLEEDLKNHHSDRDAAREAMKSAAELRVKDAAAFAKDKNTYESDLNALEGAITAIKKGMSGAFLQTSSAQILKTLAIDSSSLQDADRQDIMAFLSDGQGGQYVPKSGEIVGVLKTVKDDVAKAYAEATKTEEAAVASHEELMVAKTKEFDANNKAIESKTMRVGELAVNIVQMKADHTDTEETLAEDKHLLNDLAKNCKTKAAEWDERQKTRSDELLAIADCIKVLNDDDALELFNKRAGVLHSSLIQLATSQQQMRARALELINDAKKKSSHRAQFDFISMAIRGKGVGLEKVVKMIDDMIGTLKKEQKDEERKKEYCAEEIDTTDNKKKGLEKKMAHLESSIEDAKEAITNLNSEIHALEDGIKELDRSVADATEQRKAEHKDYTELMASDAAAKELLQFALNRLRKFYQPELYKEPKSSDATDDDSDDDPVLAQVSTHVQLLATPPPTFEGEYDKDGHGQFSVINMIQHLVKDLDKDMAESETEEKFGQKEYEELMADSADKRSLDSKSLTEKSAAKASMEADIEASKEAETETTSEMMATDKFLSDLHGECDFLLKYWDARTEARQGEIDAMRNAKSILNGVDVSLLQQQTRSLRKR